MYSLASDDIMLVLFILNKNNHMIIKVNIKEIAFEYINVIILIILLDELLFIGIMKNPPIKI